MGALRHMETEMAGPSVGMGATFEVGTDVYPYTVVAVGEGFIEIQADRYHVRLVRERVGYLYEVDPLGEVKRAEPSESGHYRCGPARVRVGAREARFARV